MTKSMKKAILLAGGAMMIALYASGCTNDQKDFFPASDSVRAAQRFAQVQSASGARNDATLQAWHFDGNSLNSLGEQKLDLMLADDDANDPMVVYLNMTEDDQHKSPRQDAIVAYLKEKGTSERQVQFKLGINPSTSHPSEDGVTRMNKTETPSATGAGSSGATETGASSSTGGGMH